MQKNLPVIVLTMLLTCVFASVLARTNDGAKLALAEWRKNFLNQIRYGESSKRLERKFRDIIDEMETALIAYHSGENTREETVSELCNCFCEAFKEGLDGFPKELRDLIRRLKLECQADSQKLSPENIHEMSMNIHAEFRAIMNNFSEACAKTLFDRWESKRHETSASLFLNNFGATISGFFENMEGIIEAIYVKIEEAL